MAAACVSFFTIPLAGHLSDKIGRKKMYLIGIVVMFVFGFIYFAMVDSAAPVAVFIAIMLSLVIFVGEAVRDAFDPRKTFA